MHVDRVTGIEVRGLRCLADVRLDLQGLTVLTGAAGAGKSSLVEACRLLHLAARTDLVDRLYNVHALLGPHREPGRDLELGVRVETADDTYSYRFAYTQDERGPRVVREELVGTREEYFVRRRGEECLVKTRGGFEHVSPTGDLLLLVQYGGDLPNEPMRQVRAALSAVEVHLPFEVRPTWSSRETGRETATRQPVVVQPTDSLELFGANLANAYHALRNDFGERHWAETLEFLRLGLGPQLDSVTTPAQAEGGRIAVALGYEDKARQVPAPALSGGELAWLGWVALFRLDHGGSLLAFDEPETHLHPDLVSRVLAFLREIARHRPVLVATHSERLLAELSDEVVVRCELDEHGFTRLARPQGSASASR